MAPEPRGPNPILAIYKKELIDALRDRRTLATMLLLPMVVYPLLVLVTSEAFSVGRQAEEGQKTTVRVAGQMPPELWAALAAAPGIKVLSGMRDIAKTSSTVIAEGARLILASGEAQLVVVPSSTVSEAIASQRTGRLYLFYDETRPYADAGVARIETAFGKVSIELRDRRMRALGVSPEAARPLDVVTRSLSTSTELGSHLASLYLPVLILFFVALSSFYPAVDLTAGEKERGTLATLLTAPIRPIEIVAGKYLCVLTIGTLAGLLNVSVIALTMLRAVAGMRAVRASLPPLTPGLILGFLGAVVLLAALVGALMLVAATLARSFQDASNLLTPVMLAVLAPAFLSFLPGTQLSPSWAAVPIANDVLLMKALLAGNARPLEGLIVLASTLAAAGLLVALAARVFTDERVLFSTEGRRVDLRSVLFAPPPPGAPTALAFAALLFAGNYYGGLLISALGPMVGVPLIQIMVNALPAFLLARWMRLDLLGLSAPAGGTPRGLLAGLLVGTGAWVGIALPALWLQDRLVPGQAAAGEALRSQLGVGTAPLPALLFALAVIPALSEELAFRGAILGTLRRRHGPAASLALQALLFAILHGSLFRLVPTGALGLLLGVLALRTGSIWPGVVAHGASNAIVLLLDRAAPQWVQDKLQQPTPLAALGLVAVAAGLALLGGLRRSPDPRR